MSRTTEKYPKFDERWVIANVILKYNVWREGLTYTTKVLCAYSLTDLILKELDNATSKHTRRVPKQKRSK